ncbi:MAG: carbohydrate ABC transporter permease [Propionibacteriaceae bacterium]
MTLAAAPGRSARRRRAATPYVLLAPTVVMLTILFAVPAVYNVWLALHKVTPYDALGEGDYVGVANFESVLANPLTPLSARNTVVWLAFATVALRLVLGLGLAVLLQHSVLRRMRVLGVARTIVLLPWMVPPTVAVAAWKWLLDGRTGLVNKILLQTGAIPEGIPFFADLTWVWPSIVAVFVWRELPFVVISFMAGLQAISAEQYEAASIDGADGWRSFWHITLPNLRPIIAVIGLFITIGAFNNFIYVWLTTGGGPGTFTQVLATQLFTTAFVDNHLGGGAAIGLLMSGFMLVFAAVYLLTVLRRGDD